MERFKKHKVIGGGAFGDVIKATNTKTGEIVAIKRMKKKFATWDECMSLREIKSLRKMSHENIVKLKEVIRANDELNLVFEFVDDSLFNYYEKRKATGGSFSENEVKSLFHQIVSGLAYMHRSGFFHRDMKPENILLKENNGRQIAKIADFGLAREIRSRPPFTEYVSTRWYRAPEILLKSPNYNSPVDIFATACIIIEIITLTPLFMGQSEMDQLYKICGILGTPSPSTWPEGFRLCSKLGVSFPQCPPIPLNRILRNRISSELVKVLSDMLHWDPTKRPTAAQILASPYFQQQGGLPETNSMRSELTVPGTSRQTHIPGFLVEPAMGGGARNLQGFIESTKAKGKNDPTISSFEPKSTKEVVLTQKHQKSPISITDNVLNDLSFGESDFKEKSILKEKKNFWETQEEWEKALKLPLENHPNDISSSPLQLDQKEKGKLEENQNQRVPIKENSSVSISHNPKTGETHRDKNLGSNDDQMEKINKILQEEDFDNCFEPNSAQQESRMPRMQKEVNNSFGNARDTTPERKKFQGKPHSFFISPSVYSGTSDLYIPSIIQPVGSRNHLGFENHQGQSVGPSQFSNLNAKHQSQDIFPSIDAPVTLNLPTSTASAHNGRLNIGTSNINIQNGNGHLHLDPSWADSLVSGPNHHESFLKSAKLSFY